MDFFLFLSFFSSVRECEGRWRRVVHDLELLPVLTKIGNDQIRLLFFFLFFSFFFSSFLGWVGCLFVFVWLFVFIFCCNSSNGRT